MASESILDLDTLIQPIPGADPAGGPVPGNVLLEFDEFRKEPDPLDPDLTGHYKPEWSKIVDIAKDTLKTKSKHLLAGVRMLEALTKSKGVPGLRDGLLLLDRLSSDCWDRLLPKPDDGEGMEIRVGPFQWLNDRTRGAKFPQTIGKCPLVYAGQPFSYHDWIDPARKEEVTEAIPKIDAKRLRTTYEDLIAARDAVQALSNTLNEKLGFEEAPDFLSAENPDNIGNAIQSCVAMMVEVAKKRNVQLTDEPAAEAAESAGEGSSAGESEPSSFGPVGVARDREGLYRQLHQIAENLRRMEPHSPIPYLLERCVKMGSLPFPELMREMVRTAGAVDEIELLLGLPKHSEAGS